MRYNIRKCPDCGITVQGDISLHRCKNVEILAKCCVCGQKATKHLYHGRRFCYEHLQDEYGKPESYWVDNKRQPIEGREYKSLTLDENGGINEF